VPEGREERVPVQITEEDGADDGNADRAAELLDSGKETGGSSRLRGFKTVFTLRLGIRG
jgi:hypothetical protein